MRYRKSQINKIKWIMISMFILGLLFSVFLVIKMDTYFRERAGLISDYNFRQMKYQEYDSMRLFWYFLGKRMKWVVILVAAAALRMTLPFAGGMSGWMGFSIGFTGTVAAVKFGFKGILMITLGMFPQGIFYIWGIGVCLRELSEWENGGLYWRYFPAKKIFQGMVILILGILTESYVNQYSLRWIYELL